MKLTSSQISIIKNTDLLPKHIMLFPVKEYFKSGQFDVNKQNQDADVGILVKIGQEIELLNKCIVVYRKGAAKNIELQGVGEVCILHQDNVHYFRKDQKIENY